ncbi:MAG: hypothetical protein IKC83_04325 [Clostridia bacterium]|nr:hypothetical protein [Clostridia bacterium]
MKVNQINGISLPIGSSIDALAKKVGELLAIKQNQFSFKILKKSIDARKKNDIREIYSVEVNVKRDVKYNRRVCSELDVQTFSVPKSSKNPRVAIIGAGPCGLFCALALCESGITPTIFERGKKIEDREKDVLDFFVGGNINEDSNVQFGEGGAGAFSDGKLNTGIKNIRIKYVLEKFVEHGAPDCILYESRPHIGTDKLKPTVKNIREKIIALGGKFVFGAKITDFDQKDGKIESIIYQKDGKTHSFDCDVAVFAIGHSARDTFEMLNSKTVLEQKAFSVGVRVEHKREDINLAQYGKDIGVSADYKLSKMLTNGRGVYTFCMCPGGIVVPATSEKGMVVTNGMSDFARMADNSNSAVLVSVLPEDFGSKEPLAGVEYQRKLEKLAFKAGGENYSAPYQLVGDFLQNKVSSEIGDIKPSYARGVKGVDFNQILPRYVCDGLKEGIIEFDKKLKGFARFDSIMTGIETRSSSPVRILRGEDMQAVSVKNLYPAGEGAGYAGGITSSAVDGVLVAEKIIEKANG